MVASEPINAEDVAVSVEGDVRGAEGEVPGADREIGSPVLWTMEEDVDKGVRLNDVDEYCGEGEAGPVCLVLLVVSMLFYLCDMTMSYVCIGYLFARCDAWVAVVPLAMAAASDLSMFCFGKVFRSQSIFHWPMSLKVLLLIPAYELSWVMRVLLEWRKHTSEKATTTKHFPRFLHAFGAMLCLVRVVAFTIPQLLYLVLVRVALSDDTPHGEAPPTDVYYVSLGVHCGFSLVTLAIMLQACFTASASTRLGMLGAPTIHPSSYPVATSIAAFLALAVYTAAVLVGTLGVDAGNCDL